MKSRCAGTGGSFIRKMTALAVLTAVFAVFVFAPAVWLSPGEELAGTGIRLGGASVYAADVELTAAGACVYCENTGEVIFEKNGDQACSPYSITKLLTCLIAVQHLSLDEEVTISAAAASQGGSEVGLQEGEVVTVEDLLYGALLPSGNDAAYALAETVSGNETDFVALMNETAGNIGCSGTTFVDSTGLSPENQTTASDFVKIARAALQNSIIKRIAGSKSYTIPKTNLSKARKLKTEVEGLSDPDSGIVCGKTGYGSETDASIAVEYNKDGIDLFIVLLGDSSDARQEDLNTLVSYAQSNLSGVKAVSAGAYAGKVRVRHGAKTRVKVYAASDGYAYLPAEGSKKLIKTKTTFKENVEAPLSKGDVVGYYDIYVGNEKVNRVPLVVREDVPKGWILSYIGISNAATIVILCVAAAFLVFVLAVRARKKRIAARKKKARERKIHTLAMQRMMEEEEHKRRGWDV